MDDSMPTVLNIVTDKGTSIIDGFGNMRGPEIWYTEKGTPMSKVE
ncbi:hypothetical protein DFA_10708 [Cavenderia fasciculata]|uniref:Uncharacterized protein n=1 Tax=Cavenderia fasciculata TaxID=261658 RepID=F4QB63_CACFS|nr:uncharacterized protein DFA_10708 [Cavenderia fasciculata]EGG14835.1 hypothetical protein DFA_10708 [Cavenderia fasciculata]|eukprot:XP_004351351.1 hypothetical protein DFA_10708 [Cavenderia fasciculata]